MGPRVQACLRLSSQFHAHPLPSSPGLVISRDITRAMVRHRATTHPLMTDSQLREQKHNLGKKRRAWPAHPERSRGRFVCVACPAAGGRPVRAERGPWPRVHFHRYDADWQRSDAPARPVHVFGHYGGGERGHRRRAACGGTAHFSVPRNERRAAARHVYFPPLPAARVPAPSARGPSVHRSRG